MCFSIFLKTAGAVCNGTDYTSGLIDKVSLIFHAVSKALVIITRRVCSNKGNFLHPYKMGRRYWLCITVLEIKRKHKYDKPIGVLSIKVGAELSNLCPGFVDSLEDPIGGDTEHHEVANLDIDLSPCL